MKNLLDEFYPISGSMQSQSPFWQIGVIVKLTAHRESAKAGNRESESKLINRLGQLRRNVSTLESLNSDLVDEVKESCDWLRSIGRKVDFCHPNPAMWITARDGKTPRW